MHRKIGLGYTAPGPRLATTPLAPPPASDITKTAPGSTFMSYGPGVRDRSQFLYGSMPYSSFEDVSPQPAYDVRSGDNRFMGRGLGAAAVLGSPAGAGTGVPPAVDVTVTQPPSQLPQLLLVAVAAWFAYQKIASSRRRDFVEVF